MRPGSPADTPEAASPPSNPSGRGGWWLLLASQRREKERLVGEFSQIRGFMPLLMKRRNGGRWSREERRLLRQQLAALRRLSPYLVVLALPGSFLLFPALAWWLDRRRQQRSESLS